MTNCPVCRAPAAPPFLRRDQVPAHQNLVLRTRAAAEGAARGTLDLRCCGRCGFVWNAAFDGSQLSYGADYDNAQTFSSAFRAHVASLIAHLVNERGVQGVRIVEVGCGQGDFLQALVEAGGPGTVGTGFDPAYTGPPEALDGRVRFERRFYDADCAHIPADVVICRHVIEHVPEPLLLLAAVRAALAGGSAPRVFFETPTVEWILRNQVVWDFFYEHCSYFSDASITTAFQSAGFTVERVEHVFGGQYLWLEATLQGEPAAVTHDAGALPGLAGAFAEDEPALLGALRREVEALARHGGVALWGAGAKGVTLANLLDPGHALIDCIVDLNPHKQGRFIPGTGHPIIGHRDLGARGVRTAVLMNPNYRAENERLLRDAKLDVALTELMEPGHASRN